MPKHKHPPAFQFYVDDFISDSAVDAMTNEELGIYIRFLCKAWKETPAGTIPDDDSVLMNWAKATPSVWQRSRAGVLRAFLLKDGRFHQKRMKLEWKNQKARAQERKESGLKGAEARWHSHSVANGKPIANTMAKNGPSSSTSSSSEALKSESLRGPPKKFRPREDYIDLSGLNWPEVLGMADAAAKRIPPKSIKDRRAWLTFAVLAVLSYGEHWLVDAAEAVVNAKESKRSQRGHFIGILKAKARDDHGTDEASFNEMFKRVRIPDEIWNSPVLGGPTP